MAVLGGDLAAVGPRAGRDLNIEHPPGTLLGLDALATGAGRWCRPHRSKPPSNDSRGAVKCEDLHQIACDEPDKPGQRQRNLRLAVCRRLEAADDLHDGGRRDGDRLVSARLIQQMSLQRPARIDPGYERRVPGGCQGARRPASIALWSSSADGNASASLKPARSTTAWRSAASAAIRSWRSREEAPSSARRTIASLTVVPNSCARPSAASSTE